MLSNRTQAKRWCFTINNPEPQDEVIDKGLFTYLIIGKEVGENGTPHLQGYVEFKNQKDLTALKKINDRIHWEVAKGNRNQNIIYCTKEGDSECKPVFNENKFREKCKNDFLEKITKKFNDKWDTKFNGDMIEAFGNYIPGGM